MFAMIGGGVFRLKVDNENKQMFKEFGMGPLSNQSKKKAMPYWEVPLEVVEDKQTLKIWVFEAFCAALGQSKVDN